MCLDYEQLEGRVHVFSGCDLSIPGMVFKSTQQVLSKHLLEEYQTWGMAYMENDTNPLAGITPCWFNPDEAMASDTLILQHIRSPSNHTR